IGIRDIHGQKLFELGNTFTGETFQHLKGRGLLTCHLPVLPLVSDMYIVDLWSSPNGEGADGLSNAFQFTVVESDFYGHGVHPVKRKHGPFLVAHSWKHWEQ